METGIWRQSQTLSLKERKLFREEGGADDGGEEESREREVGRRRWSKKRYVVGVNPAWTAL